VLYFDQIESDRFGTVRVQIWTLLHYPLHVAILLTEEGSSKFIVWWTLIEKYPDVSYLEQYFNVTSSNSTPNHTSVALNALAVPGEIHASSEPTSLSEFVILFNTVFYFFFIAAGCVLIVLGILYWCGKKHKSWGEKASIVTRIVAGVGLGLVAVVHTNISALKSYVLSPWLIPTVVLTFFVGEYFLLGVSFLHLHMLIFG
jgi:hypothetical protein